MFKDNKGIALISAYMAIFILLSVLGIYATRSINENNLAERQRKSAEAFYSAEAGIQKALWYLTPGNTAPDGSTDGSWRTTVYPDPAGSQEESLGNRTYAIWVQDGASNIEIYALGTMIDLSRRVMVEAEFRPQIPAPENAINIYGSPSKHAKVKIMEHDKKHEGEILVSGLNAGSGPDSLALGVEDGDTLDKIIDELGKHLKKGGDLEDILVGDPMNTYTDEDDNTFTASIGQVGSQGFDADLMEEIAQQLADNARSMIPTQTIDLGGKEKDDDLLDPDGDGMVQLGGLGSDVIYITDGKLKLEKGLSIEGTGTLIIDGGKLDLKHATFNWDGDIYILGNEKKGDCELKVHHAKTDIAGDIFLLGSDDGKAKLKFDNDDKKHDGYTKIVGSILAFGGAGDKSKVEMKVQHGDLDIQGFITMTGTKSKLDIHQHEPKDGESDIRIEGGICLLVPEAEKKKKEKAEIKLHARGGGEGSFVIQYNSDIVDAAIQRLSDKLDMPDRPRVVSWQEL